MNFEDRPDEAAYRATVREWIKANRPDMASLPAEARRLWTESHKAVATAWQAKKAEAGYACLSWPKQRGGAGGTQIEEAIFNQEEARAGLQFTYFMTGLHMLLPALMEFSSDDTAMARIPPAVRGEEIWCQLFSEPSSGSDSAGIRSSAVRDPGSGSGASAGHWLINGQKVWNSGAQIADYGMLIARSDPDVPKHKGLTAFWLDMKTPGVEVRPIRMMSGDNELNEVFLTDVRIPDSQRVGDIGGGWKVVISTLMNERAALGSGTGLGWRDTISEYSPFTVLLPVRTKALGRTAWTMQAKPPATILTPKRPATPKCSMKVSSTLSGCARNQRWRMLPFAIRRP